MDGGEGDVAGFNDADVGVGGVVEQVEFAVEPVVVVTARVAVDGEFFDEARAAHAGGLHTLELGMRNVGNVDVEQGAVGERVFEDFVDDFSGDFFSGIPVRILVGAEGEGDAGDSENDGLAGSGDGAGVEDTDTSVGAEVDAADDEVGVGVFHEQAEGKFDAISWSPADGGAKRLVVLLDRDGFDGIGEGDGVTGGTALGVGCDDMEIAKPADGLVKHGDAGCVDAVVVTE